MLNGNGNPKYLRITCSTVTVIDQNLTFEKLYESKGTKLKFFSYRLVGGKSSLAHLLGFFVQKRKLEKLYESKGIKPKLC